MWRGMAVAACRAQKCAGRASCQGARPRCWLSSRRGTAPTATVSPVIGPSRHPSAGDLQQGRNLQSEPPEPRRTGGQQARALRARFLCTPGRFGEEVPNLPIHTRKAKGQVAQVARIDGEPRRLRVVDARGVSGALSSGGWWPRRLFLLLLAALQLLVALFPGGFLALLLLLGVVRWSGHEWSSSSGSCR